MSYGLTFTTSSSDCFPARSHRLQVIRMEPSASRTDERTSRADRFRSKRLDRLARLRRRLSLSAISSILLPIKRKISFRKTNRWANSI